MKKSKLILNILLIFTFALLITAFSLYFEQVKNFWDRYYEALQMSDNNTYWEYTLRDMRNVCIKSVFIELFAGLGALLNLAALIIIDINFFKNLRKKPNSNS